MTGKINYIIKWIKMLFGKSVFHMKQTAGLYYNIQNIKGYYSDLRHKVTVNTLINDKGIPFNITKGLA